MKRQSLFVLIMTLLLAFSASGVTIYVDDDAPSDPGPGDPAVSDPCEDGSSGHPFDAIQEGIDTAFNSYTVLVADGTYTGTGNRDIYFRGKAITVRSENGPVGCIVDCNGTETENHRGFIFDDDEDNDSILDGFTIRGGYVHGTWGGEESSAITPVL